MKFKMLYIKKVDSTNTYARQLVLAGDSASNFCVVASQQMQGKGQLGAVWHSEGEKNLTFSLAFQHLKLSIQHQFKLSALVSLNLVKALQSLGFFKIQLKWPNDIILNKQKIAGILIENIVQRTVINTSIVGIGINVNQTSFIGLPQASSLKNATGIHYDLDEVLQTVLLEMEKIPIQLASRSMQDVLEQYHNFLFRKQKASMFKFPDGTLQPGIIQSVQPNGSMRVSFEDDVQKDFEVKEIKLMY